MIPTRRFAGVALLIGSVVLAVRPAEAATLRVPQDHQTIQAALDEAAAGDTVLVSAGTYHERIRLKPGVILKSAGDDTPGKLGLRRAETTVLDGGGSGKGPGVMMAEGATLDGFTVTGVGLYDDAVWERHYATRGEHLPATQGALGFGAKVPAIGAPGVSCVIRNNVVHHNGHVGIGVRGSEDKAVSAEVLRNVVYRNMGGGIASAFGAGGIVRQNVCFQNMRAGIGNRVNASPLIVENTCYENVLYGIGAREESAPVIRDNKCFRNRRVGITSYLGASPLIQRNECRENGLAGIDARSGARPTICANRCLENEGCGIDVQDGVEAMILNNECAANGLAAIRLGKGARVYIAVPEDTATQTISVDRTPNQSEPDAGRED